MSAITIPCPKCSAGLKLPGPQYLGRKGKCPKCQHRFVLEEPDEVELQLADPPSAPLAPTPPAAPLVGTSPRWVPDANQAAEPVFPAAPPQPSAPAFPEVPTSGFDFTQPTASPAPAADVPSGGTHELDFAGAVPTTDAEGSVASRVRTRRKKNRKGPIAIGVGTALFVACMTGLWYQQDQKAKAAAAQLAADAKPKQNVEWEQDKQDFAASNETAKTLSPTNGSQIPLDYMPFAPHLVFHVRPSEVWANDRRHQEFVNLAFDLNEWLTDKILVLTTFTPQEIEELTFALNFPARTIQPDVAVVVRLKEAQTASELQLVRFKAQIRADLDAQVFESDTHAYLLIDAKTFVVAPANMGTDLAEAISFSRQPSVDLEVLLSSSDRTREMTLLFDLQNIDTHREFVFGQEMQDFADSFVMWFGGEVQTISWSLHLTKEAMYMETLLRPKNDSSKYKVQKQMISQLDALPARLQSAVRFMQPGNLGYRKMIGRFPAMMQATALGTSNDIDSDFVRLVSYLPTHAAGNLAAGAMLTWNESTRTDFTGPAPTVATGPAVPDKVADRLKTPIFIDFRREPLQGALAYISEEIKTPIIINGDALKLAGMTQNMAQTYDLGEVPALKAIDAIIGNPDYKGTLVIVVDEETKSIQLTTRPVAEAAGLPIYDTK